MSGVAGRVLVAAVASLVALSGCETSTKLGDLIRSPTSDDQQTTASLPDPNAAQPNATEPVTTGSVRPIEEGVAEPSVSGLVGNDPYEDLNLGKKQYRAGNWGLAEKHFRRSVEAHPQDAESWVGLAASYDRLKRFELADRAYKQAIAIIGETPEILNNIGFSYMLRADYGRARAVLLKAQAMDPANPYIQNNLELLAKSARRGKGIQ